jgi:hypothetical protein
MEVRASSRELALALELGGETGERKARHIANHILRNAQAIQRELAEKSAA